MRLSRAFRLHDLRAAATALPQFRLPAALPDSSPAGSGQSGAFGSRIASRLQRRKSAPENTQPRGTCGMSREARRVLFIRSAVNGTERNRTPVASNTAFASAAATGAEAASPAP